MAQDDFLPLILLFLFGGFAVLSALLRTRARVKALVSIGLMALERLAGFALMAAALPTSGSLEAASRMGIIAAVLVALSSTVHLLKVRERNRAREASEGKRLYASIRYGTDANPRTTGGPADRHRGLPHCLPGPLSGSSSAITSPLRTFGSNQVDLGGIRRFWRHTSMNSSIVTAGRVTA